MVDIAARSATLAIEDAKRVKRLAGRVMNVLDYDPLWTSVRGKLDVFTNVERTIATLVRDGELDDRVLLERALAWAGRQTAGPAAEIPEPTLAPPASKPQPVERSESMFAQKKSRPKAAQV